MHVATWNGNETGAVFNSKVNTWIAPKYGRDHFYSYNEISVPLSDITTGDNTISFYSATVHHGMEILWPGPAISVRYGAVDPTPVHTLVMSATGNGSTIPAAGSHEYEEREVVTVSAMAASGWRFAGWSEDAFSGGTWWNNDRTYRVPVTVDAGPHDRLDKPSEVAINFTELLSELGMAGALAVDSIRVVEVDQDGGVIDENVAFQFDEDPSFHAESHASGNLVFIMEGVTAAGARRHYHVYFDVVGSAFTPAEVAAQVSMTDDVPDEGQMSFEIDTLNATYLYQKDAGGFSSLLDVNGNDWIGYHPGGGSAGEYRGIPNMVHPEGIFHPGSVDSTSTILSQGPIKATLHSVSNDGKWEAIWEIYPRYATMTVLKSDQPYWFLYEGTPGGALNTATDFMVRASGTSTPLSTSWNGDIANSVGEEWAYFCDPNVGGGRCLFLVHHEDDSGLDSYWPMENAMTVFGFGRQGLNKYLNSVPVHFTIGLMDETTFAPATQRMRSAYKHLSITLGTPQSREAGSVAFSMTGDRSVAATFVADGSCALSVDSAGSGTVEVSPQQPSYPVGSVVQLTAIPEPGWVFSHWSGDVTGSVNPVSVTMDADKAVTANFSPSVVQHTLTVGTFGNGVVNLNPSGGTYQEGTQVQLTAVADPGWVFSHWSGDVTGSVNPVSVTMDADQAVTANFSPSLVQHTLTVGTFGNGVVNLNPSGGTYQEGTQVQLTAVADPGWVFSNWSGDVTGSVNPVSVTMDADKAVTANFAEGSGPGTNLISNPGFESGLGSWRFYTNGLGMRLRSSRPGYEGAQAGLITTNTGGTNIQLYQYGLQLEPNTDYQLSFAAYSSTGHDLRVSLCKHVSPYTQLWSNKARADLTSGWKTFTINFKTTNFSAPVNDGRLLFWFADDARAGRSVSS